MKNKPKSNPNQMDLFMHTPKAESNTAAFAALLHACETMYANMTDREELIDDETGEEYEEVKLIREAIELAHANDKTQQGG